MYVPELKIFLSDKHKDTTSCAHFKEFGAWNSETRVTFLKSFFSKFDGLNNKGSD